jgi:hypothetical protein
MLAVIIKKQRFSAALALIVTAANANRVHVAPIRFWLGMNMRITVNLARGRLKYPASKPLRKPKHIDCTVDRRLCGLHGIMLIVDGARRACEIPDLVNFDVKRKANIVTHEFKARIPRKVIQV